MQFRKQTNFLIKTKIYGMEGSLFLLERVSVIMRHPVKLLISMFLIIDLDIYFQHASYKDLPFIFT